MPNRILILSASVGAGHLRAAQAIELAAKQLLPDATIKIVDVLTLTNSTFRRVYGTAYLDLDNLGEFVSALPYPSSLQTRRGAISSSLPVPRP